MFLSGRTLKWLKNKVIIDLDFIKKVSLQHPQKVSALYLKSLYRTENFLTYCSNHNSNLKIL